MSNLPESTYRVCRTIENRLAHAKVDVVFSATEDCPFVVEVSLYTQEDYDLGNIRDDYNPTEIDTVDDLEPGKSATFHLDARIKDYVVTAFFSSDQDDALQSCTLMCSSFRLLRGTILLKQQEQGFTLKLVKQKKIKPPKEQDLWDSRLSET